MSKIIVFENPRETRANKEDIRFVLRKNGIVDVLASSGNVYEIESIGDELQCSCPDCFYRELECKHLIAFKKTMKKFLRL
jgi:hypothetical protein